MPVREKSASIAVLLALSACSEVPPGADPPATRLAPAGSVAAPVPSAATPKANERDRVSLDGAYHAPAPVADGAGPRVHAKALRAWIYSRPTPTSERLG